MNIEEKLQEAKSLLNFYTEEYAKYTKDEFVCSDYEIAFMKKEATGLKISAKEAYEIFGLEVLDEVAWYGSVAVLNPKQRIAEYRITND